MRFMAIVKANDEMESGVLPTAAELTAMDEFNQELVRNGVMLAGEGLHPSRKGARITLTADGTSVTDGPFAETKELIAGFWIIQAKSFDEALAWMQRAPKPPTGEFVIELRQVFESEEFGDTLTGEQRAREDELRAASGYAEK